MTLFLSPNSLCRNPPVKDGFHAKEMRGEKFFRSVLKAYLRFDSLMGRKAMSGLKKFPCSAAARFSSRYLLGLISSPESLKTATVCLPSFSTGGTCHE